MKRLAAIASLVLLGACAPTLPPPAQPEASSGLTAKPGWTFQRQAVAAANPLATKAGARILREGGSAVDAAIAVQMVLTLVEPQSSGIGGGAFLLHFDGQRVQAFDGRETAPASASESLFLDAQGQPLPFNTAVTSGRSVGVPGTLLMLALAHRQHGRLPWARLFQPAIELAERGFPVSARLHALLTADAALRDDAAARALFYRADGSAHPVGHLLRNPELAQVLRNVATIGPIALHEGPVAQAIVAAVQRPPLPGSLNAEDLKRYQPREREALCHDHQAGGRALRICGFPPPSSGGLAVGQILGLLARSPQATAPLQAGLPAANWLHAYTEASRLAFADRARYVADPDFVTAPGGRWNSLLEPRYLDERARLMGPRRAEQLPAGEPAGQRVSYAPMPAQPEYGTSHISIVDAQGRAVAMTTTIEAGFGARRMVTTDPSRPGGFLLNNQLTDFCFHCRATRAGCPWPTGSSPASDRARRWRPRWCSTAPAANCS